MLEQGIIRGGGVSRMLGFFSSTVVWAVIFWGRERWRKEAFLASWRNGTEHGELEPRFRGNGLSRNLGLEKLNLLKGSPYVLEYQ